MESLSLEALDALVADAEAAIAGAAAPAALEDVRVGVFGKKGRMTALMKSLGGMDPEARKAFGQRVNAARDSLTAQLDARKAALEEAALAQRLASETLDMTLPAREGAAGRLHPISQTVEEIVAIFAAMGFKVAEGPDVEDDFHNFTALNIPPSHPARQMHDTFYLPRQENGSETVLRTHTSPVQVRTMMSEPPPIRIVAPGRTYRSDYDLTHTPMFHQIEGLVIDETTHMGNLKATLEIFCRAFFQVPDLPLRLRCSFFPFTEPSMEVDVGCSRQNGELKIGNFGDWLEIGGCGMVHPKVIEACGLDPERYQGFAFGMGVERMAMLKYGIPDLRTFFDADLRWLKHYGFLPVAVPNLAEGLAP